MQVWRWMAMSKGKRLTINQKNCKLHSDTLNVKINNGGIQWLKLVYLCVEIQE